MFEQPSSWPQENETAEATLRERLAALEGARPVDARAVAAVRHAVATLYRPWLQVRAMDAPKT